MTSTIDPNFLAANKANVADPLLADRDKDAGPIEFENRKSFPTDNADKYMGEKMPLRMGDGPVRSRRMTDLLFCFIFLLVFGAWIAVGIIYAIKGSPLNWDEVLDSEGRICGKSDGVRDFPYLYLLKWDAPYKSVCVRNCPKFDYNQIKYNSTGTNTTYIQPVYFENLTNVIPDYEPDIDEQDFATTNFGYHANDFSTYFTKQQYDDYTNRIVLSCATNADAPSCTQDVSQNRVFYDSRPAFTHVCVPINPEEAGAAAAIGNISASWLKDLQTARWMIIISVFTAFIVTLIFLWLTNLFITIIIWIQTAVAIFFMLALTVLCFFMAFGDHRQMLINNDASPAAIRSYQNLKQYKVS